MSGFIQVLVPHGRMLKNFRPVLICLWISLFGNLESTSLLRSCEAAKLFFGRRNLRQQQDPPEKFYALQFVGVQVSGPLSQPRTPFDPTSLCLEAGTPLSAVEGIPIRLSKCESKDLGATSVNEGRRTRQEWSFTKMGQIRSKKHPNRCLRHTNCRDQWVYDLGYCSDPETAVFQVSMRVRNSDNLQTLGRPLQALSQDADCEICGPYQVTQFCKDGRVEGSGICMKKHDDESSLGWTKERSQFIPAQDPNPGKDLFDFFSAEAFSVDPMDGLAGLTTGVCDSFVGDGSGLASYFYFKKFV